MTSLEVVTLGSKSGSYDCGGKASRMMIIMVMTMVNNIVRRHLKQQQRWTISRL